MDNLFDWYYVGVCLLGYPLGRFSIRWIADRAKSGKSKNPYFDLMFFVFAWPLALPMVIWGLFA